MQHPNWPKVSLFSIPSTFWNPCLPFGWGWGSGACLFHFIKHVLCFYFWVKPITWLVRCMLVAWSEGTFYFVGWTLEENLMCWCLPDVGQETYGTRGHNLTVEGERMAYIIRARSSHPSPAHGTSSSLKTGTFVTVCTAGSRGLALFFLIFALEEAWPTSLQGSGSPVLPVWTNQGCRVRG